MLEEKSNGEIFCILLEEHLRRYGFTEDSEITYHAHALKEKVLNFEVKNNKGNSHRVKQKNADLYIRFFAEWKRRYVEVAEMDCPLKSLSPKDKKFVLSLSKKLQEHFTTIDDYMSWFFEDFVLKNPKFMPPLIGAFCGENILAKYLYDRKDIIKKAKEKKRIADEEEALYLKARTLYRDTKDSTPRELADKHRKGVITLKQLKVRLEKFEKETSS